MRPLALLLALVALPALGDETAREVLLSGPGLQRLELDAAAVSASARADLGDLRLADASGREVPYLLVPPSAPAGRWASTRLLPIRPTRKESGFEADLGAVRAVERVRLTGLPEPFLKRYRLEGSGDRVHWTELVAEGTLFGLPADDLRLLVAAFPRGEYRWLRLTWDDRSSGRLPPPRLVEAFLPLPAPPSPAPLLVPLQLQRRPSEPGVSRFALRLPGARLPVRAIVVDVPGDRVHRPAAVTEARLEPGRLGPETLGEAVLRRVTRDGAGAETLRIEIARPEELELELRVDDGDNPPLQLAGAAAELAPLPWLYFEAVDGATLALRAGDPERTAPRYDLEAAREGLAKARPAQARLGPSAPPPPSPSPGVLEAPGALLDTGPFRYARAVEAAPPGLAAVALDAAVQGRTRDLGDLRLAGPGGRQVPYLLERREAPLVVALAAPVRIGAPPAPGVSGWRLDLPEPALPASRLVLETSARLFDRRVRVLDQRGAADGGPRILAEAAWRHADPDRAPAPLTIALPPLAGAGLVLQVDDGDNAPITLTSARLLLPGWRLRFLHPGPALTLHFGAEGVEAPRYDLAILAPRLRAAPAREVALGPAPAPEGPPLVRPATVAWGALILGVAVMLWLLSRLVKRADV